MPAEKILILSVDFRCFDPSFLVAVCAARSW